MSIGSDAVDVVEEMRRTGKRTGASSIEQISWHYGAQAMVISIDPRRVYVADPAQCSHQCVKTATPGGTLLVSSVGSTCTHCICTLLRSYVTGQHGASCRHARGLAIPDGKADVLSVSGRARRRGVLLVAVHGEGRAGGAGHRRHHPGAGRRGPGRRRDHAQLHRPRRHQLGERTALVALA